MKLLRPAGSGGKAILMAGTLLLAGCSTSAPATSSISTDPAGQPPSTTDDSATPTSAPAPASTTRASDVDVNVVYQDLLQRRSQAIRTRDLTTLAEVSSDPYLSATVRAAISDPQQLSKHASSSTDATATLFDVVNENLVMLAVAHTSYDESGYAVAADGSLVDKPLTKPGVRESGLVWLERSTGQWRIGGETFGLPAGLPGSIKAFTVVEQIPWRDTRITMWAATVDNSVCFLVSYPDEPVLPICFGHSTKRNSVAIFGQYWLMFGEPFELVLGWSEAPHVVLGVKPEADRPVDNRFSSSYYAFVVAEPGTLVSVELHAERGSGLKAASAVKKLDPLRQSIRNQRNGILE